MKKLILILTIFFSIKAGAQTVSTSYVVPSISAMKSYFGTANRMHVTANNNDYMICSPCTTDEVNIYAGAGGRKWMKVSDSLKANLSNTVDTVQNIASLQSYSGNSNSLIVTDTLQGGIFYKSSTGAVDNGIVFNANGGGYWIRQLINKDIFPEWFGAKGDGSNNDAPAINTAFAKYPGYNLILRTGKTYKIQAPINISDQSNLIGNGGVIQRDTIPVDINVLSAISISNSGTLTITVDSTMNDYTKLKVGMAMTFVNRNGDSRKIDVAVRLITNINGGTITLKGTSIAVAWTANTASMINVYPMIAVNNGATNVSIKGVTIDGARSYYLANHRVYWEVGMTISCGAANNSIIEDCFIKNSLCDGIISGGLNNRIVHNLIYWSGNGAVHLSGSQGAVIDGNYFFDTNSNPYSGHNDGAIIFSNNDWNTVITNNVIDVCLTAIGGINSTDNSDMRITGNTIRRYKTFGIRAYCPSGNTIQNIIIDGNNFYGDTTFTSLQLPYLPVSTQPITYPSGGAIYFSSASDGTLQNITVSNNTFKSAPIALNFITNFISSGNTFLDINNSPPVGVTSTLINLGGSTGTFSNNSITEIGVLRRNVVINSTSSGMVITGNNIVTDKYTFELGSRNVNFLNNQVTGGYMRFTDSATVKNNIFNGRIYAGWSGYPSKGLVIEGNKMSELTINAVDTNLIVKNNIIDYNIADNGFNTIRSGNLINNIQDSIWLKSTKDAVGNFVTRSTTNALTYRTATEVLTDIGAQAKGANGQATLVAGTKSITVAGATTSSTATVSQANGSSDGLTVKYQIVCTTNTITINAITSAGNNTVNTADVSTINYSVVY